MVGGRPLRVVFFGTPAFAVPTLDALLVSSHEVVAVVTQPDRPRGRGQKTTDAPVKARAREAARPVLQPPSIKDARFLATIEALDADLGVVVAYGKILTDAVLTTPRLGMVNVHASLLPRYRGAAPIHRAIIAGETETGVTIMRIVRALDAGPMLARARRPIGPEETSEDLERDLATIGASLLVSTIDRLSGGGLVETPQDEALATYAARLTKRDGIIDWSRPAPAVHDLIRGLHPWPHAYTFRDGKRLIVLGSSVTPDTPTASAATEPGTVVSAVGDDLRVACGSGTLRIRQLQAEGSRPMSAREFVTGHRLTSGDRFTPVP